MEEGVQAWIGRNHKSIARDRDPDPPVCFRYMHVLDRTLVEAEHRPTCDTHTLSTQTGDTVQLTLAGNMLCPAHANCSSLLWRNTRTPVSAPWKSTIRLTRRCHLHRTRVLAQASRYFHEVFLFQMLCCA